MILHLNIIRCSDLSIFISGHQNILYSPSFGEQYKHCRGYLFGVTLYIIGYWL